jgi:hypothetical protein
VDTTIVLISAKGCPKETILLGLSFQGPCVPIIGRRTHHHSTGSAAVAVVAICLEDYQGLALASKAQSFLPLSTRSGQGFAVHDWNFVVDVVIIVDEDGDESIAWFFDAHDEDSFVL